MNLSEVLGLLQGLMVGAVTAFIASYITVQLSLRRFYSEKLWERKIEAYTAIIEALHHMRRYLADEIRSEFAIEHLSAERRQELGRRALAARDELRKRIDLGRFILCDAAVAELGDFEKIYEQAHDAAQNQIEVLENALASVEATLTRIRSIARADLKLR